MNNIRFFILSLLVICCHTLVTSQNIKLTKASDLTVDPSINPADLNKMVDLLETTLNEYAEAAKLLDKTERRVTEASIDRFNSLFTPSAQILKDYAEFVPENPIPFKDYSLEVFNALRLKGVEVVIKSAVLKEFKYSPTGFYVPVIEVTKTIYNSLSADGTINSVATGNVYVQKFTFDIFEEDLSRATISHISSGADIKFPDQYTRLISASIGVGSGAFSPTLSSYWNANQSNANLDIRGGINFSIGGELLTDRLITPRTSSDRKLAFSVGVRYASYQWKSKLDSFSIEPFEQVAVSIDSLNSNRYLRMVGPVSAEENLRFGVLEIPLGIAYYLVKKKTALVCIHARFIPSFVLGGSGNLTGTGDYDANPIIEDPNSSLIGTPSDFRVLDIQATSNFDRTSDSGFGPYKADWDQVLGSDSGMNSLPAKPELSGATFAIQLSPTAYFNFSDDNPGWGMLIGVDLSYHFGSFIKHNPISNTLDNALKYNDDFEGSLLNYYATGVSGFSFGVRVGLFQRLSTEP